VPFRSSFRDAVTCCEYQPTPGAKGYSLYHRPDNPRTSPGQYPRYRGRMDVEKACRVGGSFGAIWRHRNNFILLNRSEFRTTPSDAAPFSVKLEHWSLAVTPKDTVAGNFVPKLDFIGCYHATCNCLWHRVRRDRRLWWTMIFVSIRFVIEGQLGT
jgi:hypothetical protein